MIKYPKEKFCLEYRRILGSAQSELFWNSSNVSMWNEKADVFQNL